MLAGQLRYIASERIRYAALDAMRRRLMPAPTRRGDEPAPYKRAALGLGLWALQVDEIEARFAELERMEREAPERAALWVEFERD
jgi:hypothetical protein